MRRLWAALLALCLAPGAWANYAFVQLVQNSDGSGSNLTSEATGNFTTNPTTGNAFAWFANYSAGAAVTVTITDTIGNTCATAGTLYDAANSGGFAWGYCQNISGGSADSVTAHFSANVTFPAVAALEYSGLSTTAIFTSGEVASSTSTTTATGANVLSSGNLPVLSGQPVALIALGYDDNVFNLIQEGTSPHAFTLRGNAWGYGGTVGEAQIEDVRLTATAATPATFGKTDSSAGPYFVLAMVLHEPSSGGTCTHAGYTSGGAITTPNGTTGSYVGKTGGFVTPDCSSVQYWQPALGNFGVN